MTKRGRPPGHRPANVGKRGPRKPPRTASLVLRRFFEVMDADDRSTDVIAKEAGTHRVTISYWRHGVHRPMLTDLENIAQVMGYRLELVPLEETNA